MFRSKINRNNETCCGYKYYWWEIDKWRYGIISNHCKTVLILSRKGLQVSLYLATQLLDCVVHQSNWLIDAARVKGCTGGSFPIGNCWHTMIFFLTHYACLKASIHYAIAYSNSWRERMVLMPIYRVNHKNVSTFWKFYNSVIKSHRNLYLVSF